MLAFWGELIIPQGGTTTVLASSDAVNSVPYLTTTQTQSWSITGTQDTCIDNNSTSHTAPSYSITQNSNRHNCALSFQINTN